MLLEVSSSQSFTSMVDSPPGAQGLQEVQGRGGQCGTVEAMLSLDSFCLTLASPNSKFIPGLHVAYIPHDEPITRGEKHCSPPPSPIGKGWSSTPDQMVTQGVEAF